MPLTAEQLKAAADRAASWPGSTSWMRGYPGDPSGHVSVWDAAQMIKDNPESVQYG